MGHHARRLGDGVRRGGLGLGAALGDRLAPALILLHPGDDAVHHVHRLEGKLAGRRLCREHHRVRPLEDRGRHVGGFGPGGSGRVDHALQHLGGDDHRLAEIAGETDDAFLDERHLLGRKLDAEIPPRHHHRIRKAENRLQIFECLRFFELGEDRRPSRDELARLPDVFGPLDEGEPHEIDPGLKGEGEVLAILGRERRDGQDHVGDVHALAIGEHAPHQHLADQVIGPFVGHPQAELAVIEQERGADLGGLDDFGMGEFHPFSIAGGGVEIEAEGLAGLQMDAARGEAADAELGALDVGEDADRPSRLLLEGADRLDARGVILMRAVREIEAEDVHPGAEEPADDLWRGACRAEGGDDLGAPVAPEFGSAHAGLLGVTLT